MLAMRSQASALSMVSSKSLARRRLRPNQAKALSTTHRRGNKTKPLAASERLMLRIPFGRTISTVQVPSLASASTSFAPA